MYIIPTWPRASSFTKRLLSIALARAILKSRLVKPYRNYFQNIKSISCTEHLITF